VRPADGVTADIGADGFLELFSQETGKRYRCGPVAAAMWIALRQNDDRPDLAAALLAELWQLSPESVRSDMDLWLAALRNVGLVSGIR
jgi:hypothetical protein